MPVTVTTVAQNKRLTTKERVKEELTITVTTYDALLDSLIDRASAAIESYCARPFARYGYTETLAGQGDPGGSVELVLRRTPIVGTPSSVSLDGAVITDFSVLEADQGVLYRRCGWTETGQRGTGLAGGFRAFDFGTFLPGQYEPLYSVAYVAGYILPSQNLIGVATVSVAAADQSFNDSASGFPALTKAGDEIISSGFVNAVNNGRWLVTGTPTTAKVTVSGPVSLVNEAAPASTSMVFQSLPYDVEKAAIETVKSWYSSRGNDSNIVEKHVGQVGLRYADAIQAGGMPQGLPVIAVGLLRPWLRAA